MRARGGLRDVTAGMGEGTTKNTTLALEINFFGQNDGLVSAILVSTVSTTFDG